MKRILLISLLTLITTICQAATITVSNTNDTGSGSLRQAVIDANNGDIINFNASLISTGNTTITLLSQISFSKSLTFKGLYNSNDTLFISGNNTSRIFKISNTTNVYMDSLVLINGFAVAIPPYQDYGGAVYITNDTDSLFISNSIIKGCNAYRGGGIYATNSFGVSNAFVSINNSTLNNNTGGGILVYGNLIVNSSIIKNNTGHGISVFGNTLEVENSTLIHNTGRGISFYNGGCNPILFSVTNSTISNNFSAFDGAGITVDNDCNTSSGIIVNSTISNNSNTGDGGGIYFKGWSPSDLTITNSTISNNTANLSGAGIYAQSSTVTIESSIVSNSDTNNIFNTNAQTIISNGYNIFSDAPTGSIGTDYTNITAIQINLGYLQNNGGSTETLLPGPCSIAIDNGNPTDLTNAQNAPLFGIRDVGAAEQTSSTPSFNISTTQTNHTITSNEPSSIYQWLDCDNGNAIIAGETNISYTPTTNGNYSVAINNGACSDTSACVNMPCVQSSIDTSTTVTGFTISANQAGATYQWLDCDNGNALISGETNTSYTPTTNGNYSVIITMGVCSDTSACVSIHCVQSSIDTSTTVTGFTISANQAGATYQWVDCDNGNAIITSETNINYTPITNGNYAVIITMGICLDTSACVNMPCVQSGIDTTTTVTGLTITANQTSATYQWLDCDNGNALITGETNANYTAIANGNYAVMITSGICSDTSACVNINTVGVNFYQPQFNDVVLYPNPTNNNITIDLKGNSNIDISIVNLLGEEVYKKINVNNPHLTISLTNFNQGIYFIKMQSEAQQRIIKLIKK